MSNRSKRVPENILKAGAVQMQQINTEMLSALCICNSTASVTNTLSMKHFPPKVSFA